MQSSHLKVFLLSKFWPERGDFNWCKFCLRMYFDTAELVKIFSLLLRLALAILWNRRVPNPYVCQKLFRKINVCLRTPIINWSFRYWHKLLAFQTVLKLSIYLLPLYLLEMSSIWSFLAQAELSYEGSEPSWDLHFSSWNRADNTNNMNVKKSQIFTPT